MKYCFTLFFLCICIILSGCSVNEEVDIWPLVYYEHNKEKKETRLDLLTSLYSYHDTPKQTSHAFRPFFVGEFRKDKVYMDLMFFWPFIYYNSQPHDSKIWVMPFYYYRDYKRPELGERDFDWFFLPFLSFGGTDAKDGKSETYLYMTIWGNIKGLLFYDEISATPLPFYVKARKGEYVTRGYMWPFFRFGEGGGKKFEFYCFFYSYYEDKGKFIRRSYMWPFIHYNKEDLHKKYPREEFAFLPFYGQSKSKVGASYTVLWPFFSYAYDDKLGYKEYNAPWPFFKYRSGNGIEELRLWPLYWKYDQDMGDLGKEDDLVILWPFFWKQKTDAITYKKESTYLLPFFWTNWRKGKGKNAVETRKVKVWPFYKYEKKEDGTVRHRGLSPLWFEDYLPFGIEKAWLPLFTLFDYSYGPKGKKTFSVLGPIYQYKANEESTYHRILMFSYKRTKNKTKNKSRYSFLGGLFEYGWDRGEKSLRFFYLPAFIKWGNKMKGNKK